MSIGSTHWSPNAAAPALPALPAASPAVVAPAAWGGDAYLAQSAQPGQAWGNAANAWGHAAVQTGTAVGQLAQGAAQATGQAYQAVAPVLADGAQAAGQVLGQAAQGTWNLAGQAYGALAPAFVESVKETGGLLGGLGQVVKQGLSGVGDWLSQPVGHTPHWAQPYPQGPVAWPQPAPQAPYPQAPVAWPQPAPQAPQWPAPQAPAPQAPVAAPLPCPCPEPQAPVGLPVGIPVAVPYPVYVPVPIRRKPVKAYPVPVQQPACPTPPAPVACPKPEPKPTQPVWQPGAQTPWATPKPAAPVATPAPAPAPKPGSQAVTWSKPLSQKELAFLGQHNKAAFFATLRPMAESAEQRTGVPAEIILAHAALQSAWGSKTLGAFNLFGHPTTGGRREHTSFAQAVAAHADLLSHGRYAAPLAAYQRSGDLKAYADAMGHIYAEDPKHGAKLMQLIRQFKLA